MECALDGRTELTIQFQNPLGAIVGDQFAVPISISRNDLEALVNKVLQNEEPTPYSFTISQNETFYPLEGTLSKSLKKLQDKGISALSSEVALRIIFFPVCAFKVRPITRCSGSLPGHAEAVLCVMFSPDSSMLATGSGDKTVRVWDLNSKMPIQTCYGHQGWVLAVAWAPDNMFLASSGMDNDVRVWKVGKFEGEVLSGHTKAVTCLAWQPLHVCCSELKRCHLLSGSRDCTVRIWDVVKAITLRVLSSHKNQITAVRWSGEGESGTIYSASRDTTIILWNPSSGSVIGTLIGHAHWVNNMAFNTDQHIRRGPFSSSAGGCGAWVPAIIDDYSEMMRLAKVNYEAAIEASGSERLASASDDLTVFLWNPQKSLSPVNRLQGHQKPVNMVTFSSDGRFIASASFDKSLRLWDGYTGHFVAVFRGHVGSVYGVSFSNDSRFLVSSSSDSTVKLWDVLKRKLVEDLPGHADEVYALDWSLNGRCVATGSKDKLVKLWEN